MKSKVAVVIRASEGLAQVAVSCQHARRSFVPQCTVFFVLLGLETKLISGGVVSLLAGRRNPDLVA
jgi:hypothetical protein